MAVLILATCLAYGYTGDYRVAVQKPASSGLGVISRFQGVSMNPLIELHAFGQSFWYDNIRRKLLHDGTIQNLIDVDGLRGMTSNPSIFNQAIGTGDEYDQQIAEFLNQDAGIESIYEALALVDIRKACDMFSKLYEESNASDGFVSLEVSPRLAFDSEKTIEDARRLYAAVKRPNVMIKVPATAEGIPAIRQLISEGINVNVTLMFSMKHYELVAQAYIDGLQNLLKNGGNPSQVASVASFFVSRVDTAVDKKLGVLNTPTAEELLGKTGIANSKVVYQRFKEIFHGSAFGELQKSGASVQRLLWASTSTKNPDYLDTMYIDELIGPGTVNTMPPATIDAFRDHGRVRNSLEENVEEAQNVLDNLFKLGINLGDITEKLQEDGVKAFKDSFEVLLETLEKKLQTLAST